MTRDAFLFLSTFFSNIWRLFNSWYIPGTNVTPGAFSLGLLFIYLITRRLGRLLFVGGVMSERGSDDD